MAIQQNESDGRNIISIDPVYVKVTLIYAYWQFIMEAGHHDDEYEYHAKCLLDEYSALPGHMRTEDVRRLPLLTTCIRQAMPKVQKEVNEQSHHVLVPTPRLSIARLQQQYLPGAVRMDSITPSQSGFSSQSPTSTNGIWNQPTAHSVSAPPGLSPPPPGNFDVRASSNGNGSSSQNGIPQNPAINEVLGLQPPVERTADAVQPPTHFVSSREDSRRGRRASA